MNITLNHEAAIAIGWMSVFGFTSAATVAISWIGHIHYKGLYKEKTIRAAKQAEVDLANAAVLQVNGPGIEVMLEVAKAAERRAKAEEKITLALERRAVAVPEQVDPGKIPLASEGSNG